MRRYLLRGVVAAIAVLTTAGSESAALYRSEGLLISTDARLGRRRRTYGLRPLWGNEPTFKTT